jgi:excisionase family DNA binding protein
MLSGSRSPQLRLAETIARTHHERWDGSGYPSGLAGDGIPIEGRITAVSDVFDALTHDRPYKVSWPIGRALEELWRDSGRAFDPRVVEAFAELDHGALLDPIGRAIKQPHDGAEERVASASEPGPIADEDIRTVTLREAAEALAVSGATLRRWGASGRIKVLRTSGGHRRFPISEIDRLRSGLPFRTPPPVSPTSPPSQPVVSLAELRSARGPELGQIAARALYQGRRTGWFASEAAQPLIENWNKAVSSACLDGNYDIALTASTALTQHAEIGGATVLERHMFLERFSDLSLRALVDADVGRPELVATRRLFAAIRQSLLETV